MAGGKRTQARIRGEQEAQAAAVELGRRARTARIRRRLTQAALAQRVGISRSRLADLELGRGARAPLTNWFLFGNALGIDVRVMFGRDASEPTTDAGHLAIQELVLRLGRAAGFDREFELPTGATERAHSIDVRLLDRPKRRMVIVECWNTIGDLGAASRSTDRKGAEAHALAAAIGWQDGTYQVGTCWVVRQTKRNRELVARYPHVFQTRFRGASQAWVGVLTGGGQMPRGTGLVWSDVRATRIFAHRRARGERGRARAEPGSCPGFSAGPVRAERGSCPG